MDDRFASSNNVLENLYNNSHAKELINQRVTSIDDRANFFGTNNYYYNELGIPTKWFGAAEEVSRAGFIGLGADGNWSYGTFWLGAALTGNWGGHLYDWRSEAGNTLMTGGFGNFRYLYNSVNYYNLYEGPFDSPSFIKNWGINQLKNEQSML